MRLSLSKSSIVNRTPASRATANRWSTAFVEPPVVATAAMAFSIDRLVMICRGRISFFSRSITSVPASNATSSLRASMAGTPFRPIGEMPRNSKAIAIVLAVN